MSAGILDGFQTIIPTAAAVLSEKRQILRLTQQEVADRAKITLRQYQRLESGERNILTSSFGLACRVIEALDMDVSKFYHGDYYLEEEVKTMRGKGIASRKSHRFKGRHDAKKEQYGQIYVEKFTSASLICKAFYGKMKT